MTPSHTLVQCNHFVHNGAGRPTTTTDTAQEQFYLPAITQNVLQQCYRISLALSLCLYYLNDRKLK
jgi:hypothetical protein